jgi:hypothetical protein
MVEVVIEQEPASTGLDAVMGKASAPAHLVPRDMFNAITKVARKAASNASKSPEWRDADPHENYLAAKLVGIGMDGRRASVVRDTVLKKMARLDLKSKERATQAAYAAASVALVGYRRSVR